MRRTCVKSAMVSRGSTGGTENRLGTGAAMPCPAPGKCFGDSGTSLGCLEQQLPADPVSHLLLLAREREGWAWWSLQTVGFHLISFLLSQPSSIWRKTPTPQSVASPLSPSTSCDLQGSSQHGNGPCECCAAGPAKPGRGEALLGEKTDP